MQNEHPILFSKPMVQALLKGRKTQTRRVLKPFFKDDSIVGFVNFNPNGRSLWQANHNDKALEICNLKCPYGKVGDLLWVRETWAKSKDKIHFAASVCNPNVDKLDSGWKPSIHMKKVDARIWLQITGVNVERLNSISEDDAIKEGVIEYEDGFFKNYFTKKGLRPQDGVECLMAKGSFQSLWCSINGLESWEQNPWVWVVSFEVISTTCKPSQL